MTDINYYNTGVTVNGKMSRLTYFFVDYITNHTRVLDDSGCTYTLDEATNLAYAIANREEKCGTTNESFYSKFKAIMDSVSPTYVTESSKGVVLQKAIAKLENEISENEASISEYREKVESLNAENEKLTDKLSSDANESGDEVTYREAKSKIVKQIDNNNKQISKIEEKISDLEEKNEEKQLKVSEKQSEYRDIVRTSGKAEYKAKVDAIGLKIDTARSAYDAAVAARKTQEATVAQLLNEYQVLVGDYQRMVNEHVDASGNAVTRSQIKAKGKEVTNKKKDYEEAKSDLNDLLLTEETKYNILDGYCKELEALHDEKEATEITTDVKLNVALSYFSNYHLSQDDDESLIDDVFYGSEKTGTTVYQEGVNVLDCRGQDLAFTYYGCDKEAGFVPYSEEHENVTPLYLDFWKLYDEQLALKTVYDYLTEKLGSDVVDKYIDMITDILLSDKTYYHYIKACVSMISEMTLNPASFYDKTLSDEDITAIKTMLSNSEHLTHYTNNVNKTSWFKDSDKTKYNGFAQIEEKYNKVDSQETLDSIKTNSLDCAEALTEYLNGILEEFYIAVQESVNQQEESNNPNNAITEISNPVEEEEEEETTELYDFEYNSLGRYETEAEYFQKLETDDPIAFKKIVDKFKYFQPAFHSMSPEGFNARLTFLQQCMRQGHTLEEKAGNGMAATAGNLAFGRMPVCVLRIGDFINTRIIIKSMTIAYGSDGMTWDLNPEGIGVQPMFAKVSMAVTLIGGQSLEGPVSRLQNAVSFDYYANAGVYDNRADRITIGKDESGSYKTTYNYIFNPSDNNENETSK